MSTNGFGVITMLCKGIFATSVPGREEGVAVMIAPAGIFVVLVDNTDVVDVTCTLAFAVFAIVCCRDSL